ncbi:MAG TPA: RNA polymerase sigma factor [Thermoanaerobaculia bacterium]|nr:RNA polymerase sigma factor [Thermoanaerobaculia bacterium]
MSLRRDTLPQLAYSERGARARWAEEHDLALMEGLRDGDHLALDELITRKTQPLLQVVYRILGDLEEARDVVQVTLLRVWQRRCEYDSRWQPNTWIFRIATNMAIDTLRSRRSRERSAPGVLHHLRQAGVRQERRDGERLAGEEVQQIFLELAECLTEKQRVVFVLREIEGRPSHEVARILGCRESTVRNHLFNARKVLRDRMLERYPEYVPERLRV